MRRMLDLRPGAVAVMAGLLLVAGLPGGAKRTAQYIGSDKCKMCHKSSHAALVAAYEKTVHASAMCDAAARPQCVVADFDDDPPFDKELAAYALGTGRVYQNYLDKDLRVLPGKWIVREKKWAPQQAVDGAAQCVGCHTTNFDPESRKWTQLGVGCESCHGPGAEHADSMDAADIVNLRKLDAKKSAMVCGQCHAVGTDLSGKYAFSTTFIPGDDLEKHFKLKEATAGAQNSQYNTFITSKHYAGGMRCTDCHDPHGDKAKAEHQLKKPINELCLGCHGPTIGSMKEHAPGAAETATCASCHMHGGSHAFKSTKP